MDDDVVFAVATAGDTRLFGLDGFLDVDGVTEGTPEVLLGVMLAVETDEDPRRTGMEARRETAAVEDNAILYVA